MSSRRSLPDPPFGIESIRVSNVGAIDELTLKLQSRALLTIYAGNGLGKTTLLECMSLIGHLPCFPTLRVDDDPTPSLIERAFGLSGDNLLHRYEDKLDLKRLKTFGLPAWLEQRPKRGTPWGLVEMSVFDTVGRASRAFHKFYIIVHDSGFSSEYPPKLTSILSRGDFDSGLGLDSHFCDDRSLGRCGLVVYSPNDQSGQSFDEFCLKIAKGRTFSISSGSELDRQEMRQCVLPNIPEQIEARAVSYINTDLNDFGRGNDLRESPKDLTRDFGKELHQRLRIELDGSGVFKHFSDLGDICQDILRTPQSHYTDRAAIPPSFKLDALSLRDGEVEVTVQRQDGTQPFSISFLSAGENEVFFICLMLLNFSRNEALGHSVILLDEPDLHIANTARDLLFGRIIEIVEGKSQLIVSTHSSALFRLMRRTLRKPSQMTRVLLRVVEAEEPQLITKLKAEFDGIYMGKMGKLYQESSSLNGLARGAGSFVAIWARTYFNYHYARVKSVLDFSSYFIWAAIVTWALTAVTFGLLVAGALMNDGINGPDTPTWLRNILFFGHDPLAYHNATRALLIGTFTGTFVFPAAVAALRLRARAIQRAMLDRVRKRYR